MCMILKPSVELKLALLIESQLLYVPKRELLGVQEHLKISGNNEGNNDHIHTGRKERRYMGSRRGGQSR